MHDRNLILYSIHTKAHTKVILVPYERLLTKYFTKCNNFNDFCRKNLALFSLFSPASYVTFGLANRVKTWCQSKWPSLIETENLHLSIDGGNTCYLPCNVHANNMHNNGLQSVFFFSSKPNPWLWLLFIQAADRMLTLKIKIQRITSNNLVIRAHDGDGGAAWT